MTGFPDIIGDGVLTRLSDGFCTDSDGGLSVVAVNMLDEGAFMPCAKSFLQYIESNSNGRVVNYFDGLEMNELGVAHLQRAHDSHLAMKILLLSHGKSFVAGCPAQGVIDLEVERLQKQSKRLLDDAVFVPGDGNRDRHIADVDKCAAWLINNRMAFSSQAITHDAIERCLLWSKPLGKQPLVVVDALACIGVNGAFSVNGKDFFCRDAAISYLDEQARRGKKVTMKISSTILGRDAYFFLKHKHGNALSGLLCSFGVFGIAYDEGYTSLLT